MTNELILNTDRRVLNFEDLRKKPFYAKKLESFNTEEPVVILSPDENVFILAGRSIPESAVSFYKQILNWFSDYIQEPKNETNLCIAFDYWNTATDKQIAKILLLMESILPPPQVIVSWYFTDENSQGYLSGKGFCELLDINIMLIPLNENGELLDIT